MRIPVVILVAALLLGGCRAEERDVDAERDELDARIESLRDRAGALEDSLQDQSDRIGALRRELTQREKLVRLLRDNRVGIWRPGSQALSVHFDDPVAATSAADLVRAFNAAYPEPDYPGLELLTVQNAAAYVRVKNAEQLTERMGSTGSRMYLATATLSLTSLCQVDSAYFQFEEGSHARPRYLSREDFLMLADMD